MRRQEKRRTYNLTWQRIDQLLRLLLLRGATLVEHFFEDTECAINIAHVDIGTCEIQLGTYLGHGTRFVQLTGPIVGRQRLCRTPDIAALEL